MRHAAVLAARDLVLVSCATCASIANSVFPNAALLAAREFVLVVAALSAKLTDRVAACFVNIAGNMIIEGIFLLQPE